MHETQVYSSRRPSGSHVLVFPALEAVNKPDSPDTVSGFVRIMVMVDSPGHTVAAGLRNSDLGPSLAGLDAGQQPDNRDDSINIQ